MAKYHYYCSDLDHDKSPDDCPGDYDIDYLSRDHHHACHDAKCHDNHVTVLFDHEYHQHTLDIIHAFLNTASSTLLNAAARTAEHRERGLGATATGLDAGAVGVVPHQDGSS